MKKLILCIIGALLVIIAVFVVNLVVIEKRASIISQGTLISKNENGTPALMVIDIQEATTGEVSDKECYTKNSDEYIQKLNQIITSFERNNMPVVYIRSEITNWLVNILNSSYAKGSKGAQLDKRLSVVSETVFTKDREDAFCNSKLDMFLVKNHVNQLYVVGLDAAHCVYSTIKAAKNRGYEIAVLHDAVLSESDSLKNVMCDQFMQMDVELLSTEEFFNRSEQDL